MAKKCSRCKNEKCERGCLNYKESGSGTSLRRKRALNNRVEELIFRVMPEKVNMRNLAGRVKAKKFLRKLLMDVFEKFLNKSVRLIIEVGVGLGNNKGTEFDGSVLLKEHELINLKQVVKLNSVVNKIVTEIETLLDEHEFQKSGLIVLHITDISIKVLELNMVGRSYVELPSEIRNKKCCINIKNYDNRCFLWCIIAHFVLKEKDISNPSKLSNYAKQEYIRKWDLSMVKFPMNVVDINIFELNNNLTVNVYYYNESCKSINILYPKTNREIDKERHVNLLLYREHYCLIRNLNRLFSNYTEGHNKTYVCEGCGSAMFSRESALEKHKMDCGKGNYMLPKTNYLEFKNYQNTIEVPFVIYSDFESYFEVLENDNELNTEKIKFNKIHKPLAFCFKTICRPDMGNNNEVIYIGTDSDKKFAEELYNEAIRIEEILDDRYEMCEYDIEEYENADVCFICGKGFDEKDLNLRKVRDHDHINGKYRGAAHNICNLQYTKLNYTVPVIFHNLEGYDLHLFIESLSKYTKKYDIIPKSKEKYLSMCVNLIDSKIRLKFIDSLHFITGSLEENAKRLNQYKFTSHEILREKQVYPYSYMTVTSRKSINDLLNEKSLPLQREDWYNDLTKDYMKEDDIKHAHMIFDMFKCRNINDYTLLYLQTDVVLLSEIFENFRDVSLKTYKLDPSWYYTTPGFAWVFIKINFRMQHSSTRG